jgi:Ca2+-binding RTX toxin-like protein
MAVMIGVFTETMLNFESIYAGGGSDLIIGTTGTNKIYAGAGNDFIYGDAGDDFIYGGAGDDYINSGAGNDFIYGDAGNDNFYFGGAAISAANTVNSSLGIDTITDFTQGPDKIVLSRGAFTNITAGGGLNFATVANDADVSAISTTATIVYSRGTRTVFYNENGNATGLGAGGAFAFFSRLDAGVDIQASDFTLAA